MGFRKSLAITRYASGSYVDGIWNDGNYSTLSIKASVQPLKPFEMQSLPEGRRSGKAVKLYSKTKLFSANESTNADKFVWNGTPFEVVSCDWYQSSVISHFLAYAVEVLAN